MVQARQVNLRFRDAVLSDAARISDLAGHTFSETFGHVYSRSDMDAYMSEYFSQERVERDLNNSDIDYRVAESSSNLVGYAKIGPSNLPIDKERENILQLHRLYVREARQGVGVGGILLSWAIDRASERGAEELCLGVWANNQHAIGVYESRGFEAEGKYNIQVGQTTDSELIMSLKLKARIDA